MYPSSALFIMDAGLGKSSPKHVFLNENYTLFLFYVVIVETSNRKHNHKPNREYNTWMAYNHYGVVCLVVIPLFIVIMTSHWHHYDVTAREITIKKTFVFLHSLYIVWWGNNCRNASRYLLLLLPVRIGLSPCYIYIHTDTMPILP